MKPSLSFSVLLVICLSNLGAFAGSPHGTRTRDAHDAAMASAGDGTSQSSTAFVIPGPRRSFLRMAGISQNIRPDEVLPLFSRNVFTDGYEGTSRPTEFLILLRRYVVQARELSSLAAQTDMVLRVSGCDDAGPLLRILGYRTRANCGDPKTSLQTADPERAFLAIDSGFPLPALEQTLQGGKPFEYAYSSEGVPVLFAESNWTQLSPKNLKENSRDLLDTILNDPAIARLYWAMSRIDPETSASLSQSPGLGKLLPYAAVLDFYGGGLCINNGSVVVPGGSGAIDAWKELVGADPASPGNFVRRLIARDKGWLAAYFDVLSRTDAKRQEYFTNSRRLPLFYAALRTPDPSIPATRGSFRPAPGLLLLATRLQLDDSGIPLFPGSAQEWRNIFFHGSGSTLVKKWGKQLDEGASPDQLVRVMFALSRTLAEPNPLDTYLAISELDSRRSAENRFKPETVGLLNRKFEDFSAQYRIFSEFPELNAESIALFLQMAEGLNNVSRNDRGNAFGIFQANVGLWQILARQGQISNSDINESFQGIIKPFATVRSAAQLYDAGHASLAELFRFSAGKPIVSQDKIIELLAGPVQTSPAGKQVHQEVASRIRSALDSQRLISLDTLVTVGDALTAKAHGKQPEEYVILLASQTREFQMPRPIFTMGEREEWASGIYNNRHTDLQMKADIPAVLKSTAASGREVEDARGRLASFLRDSLVGLNYAYYEPPGAEALRYNPLLVRSHDFAGDTVSGISRLWQEPQLFGQGSPAGGGAHFVGSLANLPYAMADLEQDFISPNNVQALIWNEVTPELLASSIIARWWRVSPTEMHAIALYQRAGEEILTSAGKDPALRDEVVAILSERMLPRRTRQFEQSLRAGDVAETIARMMPTDLFRLAAEFHEKHPDRLGELGSAAHELQELLRQQPEQVSMEQLSRDFGIPHPVMADNNGRELLNVRPMPPFSGVASRLMAESWDSPLLYWGRLADEGGYPPVVLNHLVPELTRRMIENIFATDFEDWAALLRAMHETGEQFRSGKIGVPATMTASRN